MTKSRSRRVILRLGLLALIFAGGVGQAHAASPKFPRNVPAKIKRFITENNLPYFLHQGKLHFAVDHEQAYMQQYTQLGPNMVDFLVDVGHEHLYTRVGQTEYDRTGTSARRGSLNVESWTLNSAQKRISVLVDLKPNYLRRLKAYLVAAHDNPTEVMGEWNYQGGKPPFPGGTPPFKSNCTSYIVRTLIGDNGESMHEVCGVPKSAKGLKDGYSPLGHPQSWLNSLILSDAACVRAVVIHNHEGEMNPEAVDLSF